MANQNTKHVLHVKFNIGQSKHNLFLLFFSLYFTMSQCAAIVIVYRLPISVTNKPWL